MFGARYLVGALALAAIAAVLAVACIGSSGSSGVTLSTLPPATAARYRFVEANQELVEQLPCYCGCMTSAAHGSLYDCFVEQSGSYSAHAGACGICLAEAADAEALHAQGVAAAAIRAYLDGTYARFVPSGS